MDLSNVSLEALIHRATNVSNQGPDSPAIEAICNRINKEPDSAQIAVKFIIAKAHSLQEWEALQALLVLENCMKKCKPWFHAEVGKFRFLNELIKLVSPKYLGAHTADSVKRRVLELMADWSLSHPREPKIREAYEMLKKQGVVQEDLPSLPEAKAQNSIFQDEEKSSLLQKLLRSNNPVDLQSANRLIKAMVKEDERRVEEKWRNVVELETVVNNCQLLKEMLESYSPSSSEQDLDLIKELHTTCHNLRPVLIKLANNSDPVFCSDVLSANDELSDVLNKYKEVMSLTTKPVFAPPTQSLLDFSMSPMTAEPPTLLPQPPSIDLISSPSPLSSDVTNLDEILSLTPSKDIPPVPSQNSPSVNKKNCSSKGKGLEELDLLGETLLKEILSTSQPQSKKNPGKIPMNQLLSDSAEPVSDIRLVDAKDTGSCLDRLVEVPSGGDNLVNLSSSPAMERKPTPEPDLLDEPLLLLAPSEPPSESPKEPPKEPPQTAPLPLSDITVTLSDIKPSSVPSYQAPVERNGISLVVTLAKDRPREDVSVFVITTTSTCPSPLNSFLFQPVVPKFCRLRLLTPSAVSLPAHNPFLPPSAITQIMLIASPNKEPILLKFIVSYIMEEETITEMNEISNLALTE